MSAPPRTVGVFVGRPVACVDAAGVTFRSALPRQSVAGPALATALGFVGDAVANTRVHGGPERALCVYPARHYAAWRVEGGPRFAEMPAFGENLCVDGLDEDTVCVDDIYDVGGARVQVAAPRAPCAKVARFLASVHVVPLDSTSARRAGVLRAALEKQGRAIGPYDVLLAGQALAHGFKLISGNLVEFSRVEGLPVEGW